MDVDAAAPATALTTAAPSSLPPALSMDSSLDDIRREVEAVEKQKLLEQLAQNRAELAAMKAAASAKRTAPVSDDEEDDELDQTLVEHGKKAVGMLQMEKRPKDKGDVTDMTLPPVPPQLRELCPLGYLNVVLTETELEALKRTAPCYVQLTRELDVRLPEQLWREIPSTLRKVDSSLVNATATTRTRCRSIVASIQHTVHAFGIVGKHHFEGAQDEVMSHLAASFLLQCHQLRKMLNGLRKRYLTALELSAFETPEVLNSLRFVVDGKYFRAFDMNEWQAVSKMHSKNKRHLGFIKDKKPSASSSSANRAKKGRKFRGGNGGVKKGNAAAAKTQNKK